MEIHISYTYRNHLAPTHPPVPSQFSYVLQSPESWVLGPVLIFSLCQSLMTSQCQCMTPQRLIRAAKLRFAQWKIKILHVLHNLGVKKKKKENRCCFEAHSKAVTFHTITSLWNVFSLSTLYFKLNFLCESFDPFLFLNAHANFDTCWNKEKKTLKNDYHVGLREDNPRTPDMLFITPRNFHATREEILSAGKPIRSKNNFRVITMGRVPIWGINSLSTFILSWLYGVCIILTEVYLTVHKWTCNESDFFGIPEFHSMFTQIYS